MKFSFTFRQWIGLLGLLILFPASYSAQSGLRNTARECVRLKMTGEEGSNGASVAWDADQHLYYACFAGNASYPIETFNASGKNLNVSSPGIDVRGLWYNPSRKDIEGNAYNGEGLFVLMRDQEYFPYNEFMLYAENNEQPGDQATGAYNASKKMIYFLTEDIGLQSVTRKGTTKGKIVRLDIDDYSSSDFNYTTLGFTGVKGKEIVLLNVSDGTLMFYSLKGRYAGKVALPEDAVLPDSFNFAFTHGIAFLFDKDTRTWTGYEVFQ